jgi:hypothetical protein
MKEQGNMVDVFSEYTVGVIAQPVNMPVGFQDQFLALGIPQELEYGWVCAIVEISFVCRKLTG